MGRNLEVVVHKGIYEERGHPWGPSGVQEVVHPPFSDHLQGESFDQVQTAVTETERKMSQRLDHRYTHMLNTHKHLLPLCVPVHQAQGCFLCMSHLH